MFAARAVEAGAYAYLCKQESSTALADAIRRAAAASGAPRPHASTPVARDRAATLRSLDRLSPREFQVQVFLLLGRGHRVSEIARQLGLSPKTVSTHRARILAKTSLRSNAEIVRYVAANGMLDQERGPTQDSSRSR